MLAVLTRIAELHVEIAIFLQEHHNKCAENIQDEMFIISLLLRYLANHFGHDE